MQNWCFLRGAKKYRQQKSQPLSSKFVVASFSLLVFCSPQSFLRAPNAGKIRRLDEEEKGFIARLEGTVDPGGLDVPALLRARASAPSESGILLSTQCAFASDKRAVLASEHVVSVVAMILLARG